MCEMMISPGVFIFHFSKILIFRAVREVKGQKIAQNEKITFYPHVPYFRNSIAYDMSFGALLKL